ncbi:MAG TPA: alpha/beta family hydrolase [Burkholderiales bacterium]|nr:alpha/beta family hydrolase [Burkholderiales bacterium]
MRRGAVESGLLVSLVQIAAVVAIGVPLVMYLAQDRLIFMPQPLTEASRLRIQNDFPSVESLFIQGEDGTRLHAWYGKGEPLVLYFGGNAEEVSWMLGEGPRRLPGTGWLLVDYRGYGASEGSPSEKALVDDALRWYDRVSKDSRKIYVFGRSLGSGVAVQLAAARPVAGVILIAPYDSLAAVGQHHYPFLPVGMLLRHRFDSVSLAPQIKAPLLCLVAERDEIIPAARSRALYEAWAAGKTWVELKDAGHNSTDGSPQFWASIREFAR